MPKRLTVFYSWQSDTPSSLNRNFIEKALHAALEQLRSDATVEMPERGGTLELDKDTQGVPGSPPIVETILQKISECTVFVADLTFVGESAAGLVRPGESIRCFPNPNVLIEYGYALRCHGHQALIGIMNRGFGKPDSASLPFDLRHLRWPITYSLSTQSDAKKQTEFEKLVETLVEALRATLEHRSPVVTATAFVPQRSTKSPAVYFEDPKDLLTEDYFGKKLEIAVPDKGQAFLRLYPTAAVPPLVTELDAAKLIGKGV
ncbi:MAG TPA: hypothetical protein VN281_07015, partial [Verrucomicrobiae bacterium]|nr:hypothetical protein [Verrucomicrobiae bacterium]